MPVSCKRCGYTREVHLLRDALSVIDAQAQALAAAEAARDEVQRRLTDALGALDESNALALRQGHRAQQAEAQRLALTQALERLRGYATHKADCPRFYVRGSHDPFPDKPCDCGLDAALAAPSGTPPTNQGT